MYSLQEYYKRLQIFTENRRRVDKHNEGNHTFTSRNSFSLHFWKIILYIKECWALFHFLLQWGWTSFLTWHLGNSESLSSGLSRRYSNVIHTGSGLNRCLISFSFFVTVRVFILLFCRTALRPRGTTSAATDHCQTPSTGGRKETMWHLWRIRWCLTALTLFSVIDLKVHSILLLGNTTD